MWRRDVEAIRNKLQKTEFNYNWPLPPTTLIHVASQIKHYMWVSLHVVRKILFQ